jgi:hypothetical protein
MGGEDRWLTGVADQEVEAAQEFCVGWKNYMRRGARFL